MTRSSGSGMRDLPCAGPEFSCIFLSRIFSRPGFRHQFLFAFSQPARKEHNKPESSAAKLYCLHLQEQECKNPKPQKRKPPSYIFRSQSSGAPGRRARSIVYIFRQRASAGRAEPERCQRERMAETPSPLRRSYPSLRTHHSLIGCSPWPS